MVFRFAPIEMTDYQEGSRRALLGELAVSIPLQFRTSCRIATRIQINVATNNTMNQVSRSDCISSSSRRWAGTNHLPIVIVVLALLIPTMLATSCNFETLDIGPVKTEEMAVELGQATSALVAVSIGTGSLYLDGDGVNLMDSIFTYNVDDWKPEVHYEEDGALGRLSVSQPKFRAALPVNMGDIRYEWAIHLNDDLPINLSVTMGAGDGELILSRLLLDSFDFKGGAGEVDIDLRGSTVNDLDVALGAGDVALDLSGQWLQDVQATIKGGLGRVRLILPSDVGVRVTTQGMLSKINAPDLINNSGTYTNARYGQSDVSMNIDIESGIGEIVMEFGE